MTAADDRTRGTTPRPVVGDAPGGIASRIRAWPHETHVFGAVSVGLLVIATLYTATGGEAAGIVLLYGAFLLTATYAVYLAGHADPTREAVNAQEEGDAPDHLYLPTQSLWPAGIGAGGVLVLAGFAVGSWVLVAGAILLVRSVVGFVVEGRRRR